MTMNHDNDYHDDINYGNRFPDGWYYYDDKERSDSLNHYIIDNDYED